VRTVMSEMGMAMMGSGTAKGDDRAREAAEAAVASPLLEDIDLMGANGILVNVTAGLDLGIGEFEEVGNTVKEFASENATVVVGTVIDPDMRDELRVTVVATGLGMQPKKAAEKPTGLHLKTVARETVESREPENYDIPTVKRRTAAQRAQSLGGNSAEDMDYLDIPAFLRRQAD
jgi:cell division protein FtsZ